jgi:uncharacterized membrane protein
MFHDLFPSKRHRKLFFLMAAWTLFVAALIFVRIAVTQHMYDLPDNYSQLKETRGLTYAFLGWNLVLAWVPYVLALVLTAMYRAEVSQKWLWLVGVAWLFFLPNAPYILTDMLHLRAKPPVPIWFDLILLFSAAWTGLLLGFLSIREVHKLIKLRTQSAVREHSMMLGILALTGYGVWLGRWHRWNTWDIITRPQMLVLDVFDSLTQNPVAAHAWSVSTILFVFLALGYYTMLAVGNTIGDSRK